MINTLWHNWPNHSSLPRQAKNDSHFSLPLECSFVAKRDRCLCTNRACLEGKQIEQFWALLRSMGSDKFWLISTNLKVFPCDSIAFEVFVPLYFSDAHPGQQ